MTNRKDSDDRRVFRRKRKDDLVDIGVESISDTNRREVSVSIDDVQPPISSEPPSVKTLNPSDKNILGYLMGLPANNVNRTAIITPINNYLDDHLAEMPFWYLLPIQKREQLRHSYEEYYIEALLFQGYNSMVLDMYDEIESPGLELEYLKFNRNRSRIKKQITEDQIEALVSEYKLDYDYDPLDLEIKNMSESDAMANHSVIVTGLTTFSNNAGDL